MKKLTKRQRKAKRAPNAMVERCKEHGHPIIFEDRHYLGAVPQYSFISSGSVFENGKWVKTSPGIPYVLA